MSEISLISLTEDSNYSSAGSNPMIYNIVEDYPWTVTPKQNRTDVPHIVLVEHEQDMGNVYASANYWRTQFTSILSNNVANPYDGLYSMNATGTSFVLPYYEEYNHNLTQNWNTSKGVLDFPLAESIAKGIENIAKIFNTAPGTQVNQPRIWNGIAQNSYTVSFHLFNTINSGDIIKNKKVIRRLQMSTLHDQRSLMLISPPAIFTVYIPGMRYSPASVISNLSISNVGQMNLIKDVNDDFADNVPDAYKVVVTIFELVSESRQVLNACIKKDFDNVTVQTNQQNKPRGSVILDGYNERNRELA